MGLVGLVVWLCFLVCLRLEFSNLVFCIYVGRFGSDLVVAIWNVCLGLYETAFFEFDSLGGFLC